MKNIPTQIANFAVTYRCNSRCQNCNIWQQTPDDELSLGEIKSFFEENRRMFRDVKSIQLTGGEPFLREDLFDIAKVVSTNIPGCMVWIPTNGLMPDHIKKETSRMLSERIKLGVTVSLDGIADVNDKIRGVKGSYMKARKTLSLLSTVKKAQPNLDLSVGLTITPENLKEAPIIQKIAYNSGADFSFRPVNRSDFYYQNDSSTPINHEDLENVLRAIMYNVICQKGRFNSLTMLRYIQGVREYLKGERSIPCTAGSNSFFLDPKGNVYPCLVMDRKLGNICEESFTSIWKSKKAEETRAMISKKMCPSCWLECEAYRDINNDKIGLTRILFQSLVDVEGLGVV